MNLAVRQDEVRAEFDLAGEACRADIRGALYLVDAPCSSFPTCIWKKERPGHGGDRCCRPTTRPRRWRCSNARSICFHPKP